MFFKCRVCLEKDKRITELKEHMIYLKALMPTTSADPLPYALEAQKILDGSMSEIIDITPPSKDKLKEMNYIKLEESKMLSGDEIVYE